MLAHLGVLEPLLVDFAARKALLENVPAARAQSTINTPLQLVLSHERLFAHIQQFTIELVGSGGRMIWE
jgi:hypothetical protein